MPRRPEGSGLRTASSPPTTAAKREWTPSPSRIFRAMAPGLLVWTASGMRALPSTAAMPG